MTEADDPADADPLTRIRFYSCYDVGMYRAFPNVPGVDIVSQFGHKPVFPPSLDVCLSPRPYISRHYKLRNAQQAGYKIRRIRSVEPYPGIRINTQYANYTGDASEFVVPSEAFDVSRTTFDASRPRGAVHNQPQIFQRLEQVGQRPLGVVARARHHNRRLLGHRRQLRL